MGIYRHSVVLVSRLDPASTDLESGVVTVRPVDGDGITDVEQVFRVQLFAEQIGAGTVNCDIFTSFGDGIWTRTFRRSLTQDTEHALTSIVVDPLPPYIKVKVSAEVPFQGNVEPTFKAAMRLISNGPFRTALATVPRSSRRSSRDRPSGRRAAHRAGGAAMKIAVKLAFDERAALRLLNWLAQENAILLRAQPDLPLLYDSGVTYRRETDETWCDYLNMLAQGHEDCDGLAAARAGELIARGIRALREGDEGFAEANRAKAATLPAEVLLTTRSEPDAPGLYHCVVRYRVGSRWFRDDPSARLGMNGGRIDPLVKQRRTARAGRGAWRTA